VKPPEPRRPESLKEWMVTRSRWTNQGSGLASLRAEAIFPATVHLGSACENCANQVGQNQEKGTFKPPPYSGYTAGIEEAMLENAPCRKSASGAPKTWAKSVSKRI